MEDLLLNKISLSREKERILAVETTTFSSQAIVMKARAQEQGKESGFPARHNKYKRAVYDWRLVVLSNQMNARRW